MYSQRTIKYLLLSLFSAAAQLLAGTELMMHRR
jgi:hypothetical protein